MGSFHYPGAKVSGTKVPRPAVRTTSCCVCPPRPGKGRRPVIRALEAQRREIRLQPAQIAPLLAPFARLCHPPRGRASPRSRPACPESCAADTSAPPPRSPDTTGSYCATASSAARSPESIPVPQMPASDDTQYRHVDHSFSRSALRAGQCQYVGQISMQIIPESGSVLGANRQTSSRSSVCGSSSLVKDHSVSSTSSTSALVRTL